MKTCKDCLHYDVCKINDVMFFDENDYLEEYGKCKHFQDKSKFIELPCKLWDWCWLICYNPYHKEQNEPPYYIYDDRICHYSISHYGEELKIVPTTMYFENGRDNIKAVCYTKEEAEARLKELNDENRIG